MFYVYILKSLTDPQQIYFGFTTNLSQRLKAHNGGQVIHTAKFIPWEVITYTVFNNKKQALEFERYLKSGSGRVFTVRHFL